MNAHEAIAQALARAFVTFPTCDSRCSEGNGHSGPCRVRRHRAAKGRKPQGYVVTDEDLAIAARVAAADPLPRGFVPGTVSLPDTRPAPPIVSLEEARARVARRKEEEAQRKAANLTKE